MNELIERQLEQARLQIANFRSRNIGLNTFLSRIEGIAHVVGDNFWAEKVFPHALVLEQINADIIEGRRGMTPLEYAQAETLVTKIETCFAEIQN